MREIQLTNNHIALVDDGDYEQLNSVKWIAHKTKSGFYASRRIRLPNGAWTTEYMHRVILDAPPGFEVDHENGNGLDNRRHNIRLSTHRENLYNQRLRSSNKSGYKGVSWTKARNKWQASIKHNGKSRGLGYFDNPRDAALAYDNAALMYFGEFARLNFDQ